ncbi:MAG: CO dehydrogenase/CO-methylating acetyl-CoA synthase complex subunit beta, partial [Planctomycetota bacterium]|nr:CO dehydrogenase/CO-methylating acetyl-CoA synthase complex subunit beta [Planctomycetota bacterium]
AAIRGAHKLAARAEKAFADALKKHGADKKVEFPNTGYYAPIIYAMTGFKVEKIADLETPLKYIKNMLPPIPTKSLWVPFLGHALDAGMAALFADEIVEILKYLQDPLPYVVAEACPETGNFYLGAADDIIMRKRGVEFVDGSAPGFAACVGECKDSKTAVKIARELQEKNIYTFIFSDSVNGKTMADQLRAEGVQMGWETRLVPFSKDVTGACFPLGFAIRAAMAFGGVKPGDGRRALLYNKNRVFAFVLAFGTVNDEQYAQAAGAINYGFPALTESDIPEILPTGVCTYEHVVSNLPAEKMVAKAIEVRGLKLVITKVPIPVAYGAAFEGERIRGEDTHVEMGGTKTPAFEYLVTRNLNEVEDGKIEVIGKELDQLKPGSRIPFGMVIEVAGRQMQSDFEP